MSARIRAAIEKGDLPLERDDLLLDLMQDGDTFVPQEGSIWDFKREWPFSYSDEYFASIARLICAFANSNGGVIVFGVHDEQRTPGHNKVAPNMDRLQQSLDHILTESPQLKLRRYNTGTPIAVEALLVLPLPPTQLPIRFTKPLAKLKSNVIWVRQNHEVVPAEPRHVPLLYCRSFGKDKLDDESLSGNLPPSPATIKRFVGRMTTIDKIFRWIKLSDEPRTFLYGKGGSGKTTVAYEVAKVLKSEGGHIVFNGDSLDNIIFVTCSPSCPRL